MFPGALLVGFIVVLTWCVEPLVFGVEFAELLENPTISVGMVSRLSGSAVYLTYPIQDFLGWIGRPCYLGGAAFSDFVVSF